VAQILIGQGAVLYVKTNIPQTMMTAESDNNLFGRVLNPHSLLLTAGGSSGGEGALLAMKGSIIGVGTDIGGSIRIPAYVNGTIGFRPTARRFPVAGQESAARPGGWGILSTGGPLTRSVRDVEYFLKNFLSAENDIWSLDETAMYAPWRSVSPSISEVAGKKLRIGFVTESNKFPLHPSVLRTFKDAISKLEIAGHIVVNMEQHLPSQFLDKAVTTAYYLFSMDPTNYILSQLKVSGEPPIPSISNTSRPELKHYQPTVDDAFRVNLERREVCNQFKNAWVKEGLDVLIMPVYQGTAVGHDTYGPAFYTLLANLVDYPSVSIPHGNANAELDVPFRRDVSYVPAYVPNDVEGAPSGFQILGRPGRDEELVVSLKIVENAIRA
jgi:amidase